LKVRKPCQAGGFYANSLMALRSQLEGCFTHKFGPGTPSIRVSGPRKIIGLICPHAGYMYSGPIAAHSYYMLAMDGKPDVIVILGPNHSGQGSVLALMGEGAWRTPLGDVSIDSEAAQKILQHSEIIDIDPQAHNYEHSISTVFIRVSLQVCSN
jgi:AmmeMemoRadiSam system protein B